MVLSQHPSDLTERKGDNMIKYSKFIKYANFGVGRYYVKSIGLCRKKDIVIRGDYRKHPVVRIGESAFEGNVRIETVFIPEGVKTIGANAFKGCTSLKKVSLPSTLEHIEEGAFAGCSNLQDINFPKNLGIIASSVFNGCTSLTCVKISHVGSIRKEAFKNSGIIALAENWTDGVCCIDNWVIDIEEGREYCEIPKCVVGFADGAFDKIKKITLVKDPDYDEKMRCYNELYFDFYSVYVACVESPPKEYMEIKPTITLKYGGTLADWGKIKLPTVEGTVFTFEIIAVDGQCQMYL